MRDPRPLTMVRLTKEAEKNNPPFISRDFPMLFLGEIKNMKGHGAFIGQRGHVHAGLHIDQFEEIPEDEV